MSNWITTQPVIAQDDLPEGERRCVEIEGKHLVVFNLNGTLHAISNVCPHAGRPLEDGELRGKIIICPSHGYSYRIDTGDNIDYPDIEPGIVTFPARFHAGKVEIQISSSTLDQADKVTPPPPFQ